VRNNGRETATMAAMGRRNRTQTGTVKICCTAISAMNVKNGRMYGMAGWRRNLQNCNSPHVQRPCYFQSVPMQRIVTLVVCLVLLTGGLCAVACFAQSAPEAMAHSCCHKDPACKHNVLPLQSHQAVTAFHFTAPVATAAPVNFALLPALLPSPQRAVLTADFRALPPLILRL
jgi:hypothetical protein